MADIYLSFPVFLVQATFFFCSGSSPDEPAGTDHLFFGS